jgi:signal transduction histidine kinase
MGDEMRLAEAAYHLIHNAIKFNRPGGKVNIRYWEEDAKLMFEVEDTGYGIPAEKLELLWNLFSQMADPLRRGIEGLGLGLALVKYVVNAHEGEVDVVSQEDVGSTFRFWIPLQA